MNKIRVIDILNKIANGEEVPKKILLNRIVFEYQGDDYLYKDEDKKEYWLFSACYTDKYMWLEDFLKGEVEIIDDEEWRTIFDFPNYEVSNKGNIRSKEYNDSLGHLRSSKKLKKQVNNCGYEYVILSSKEEKHKTLTVHRIVAKTFIPNPEEKEDVNHIDGNKLNNNVNNLEWTTTQENIIKRYKIGIDGNNYKRVSQFDKDGNLVGSFPSSYEAERITGISRTHIGGCCRGERLTAGGYVWKFEIEEPKKIENIKSNGDEFYSDYIDTWISKNKTDAYCEFLMNKINELIDEINNLKEK